MDVKKNRNDSGQSVVEFLLFLPALIFVIVVLIKVNSAIQISIVNQKYARAQTLFLTYNSPIYPELRFRSQDSVFVSGGSNQMYLGVSNNVAPSDGDEIYQPEASWQNILPGTAPKGDDPPLQSEPKKRQNVRVRTTVSLCTQANSYEKSGNIWSSIYTSYLPEGLNFSFCRSKSSGQ